MVPTLDDLTLANVEAQRLSPVVTGIEFLATILQSTAVVHLDLVTCSSTRSVFLQFDRRVHSTLTSSGLAGTFHGLVDLDVERLVESRSCCGKECQGAGQSGKLHFFLFIRMFKGGIQKELQGCCVSEVGDVEACEMEAQPDGADAVAGTSLWRCFLLDVSPCSSTWTTIETLFTPLLECCS